MAIYGRTWLIKGLHRSCQMQSLHLTSTTLRPNHLNASRFRFSCKVGTDPREVLDSRLLPVPRSQRLYILDGFPVQADPDFIVHPGSPISMQTSFHVFISYRTRMLGPPPPSWRTCFTNHSNPSHPWGFWPLWGIASSWKEKRQRVLMFHNATGLHFFNLVANYRMQSLHWQKNPILFIKLLADSRTNNL